MEFKIDVQGVQDTIALLRKVEPESLKAMRKEIQGEPGLTAAVSQIKSQIPAVSPLQGNQFGYGGMLHNGRTSYKVPTVKVRTPLNTRLGRRAEKPIVSIDTISPPNAVGFEIIDLVGSGRRGNTRQAEGMKQKLAGSPSRFVWKNFESRVAGIQKGLDDILKRYAAKVNVKLRTR